MSDLIKMKLSIQHRSIGIQSGDINKDARTVSLSFSSEQPYDRWWGTEILGHNAGEVNLNRLTNKAALLDNHDARRQIGVIESTEIKGGKGYATVRFSKNPDANEVFQDVLDGIKTNVSVGYMIDKMDMIAEADGKKTYRVTSWEPMEISMVSIPADTSIGVGREEQLHERDVTIDVTIVDRTEHSKPSTMETQTEPKPETKPEPKIEVNHEAIRQKVQTDELARIRAISEAGVRWPQLKDQVEAALKSGMPVDEFNKLAMDELYKTANSGLQAGSSVSPLHVPKKDAKRYSVCEAIRLSAEGKLSGIGLEMSQEVATRIGRNPNGFFIPAFAFVDPLVAAKRDLATLTNAGGGYTVETELLGTELVDLLRNKMFVMAAGARYLGGLQGNVAIPRQSGAGTAYWIAENADVTESDQAFGQFTLAPHTLSGQTAFSKQLLTQSSIDAEGLVRNDLNTILAEAQDLAALAGSGAAGQPTGILTTTVGVATAVTFGATATWAKILAFESNVATLNADVKTMKWITSPGVRGAWKGVPKVSAYPVFLWEDDMVNGYGAFATNQIAGNKVIFGNWSDLIIANWAGIDVVTDPYTKASRGEIVVTIRLMADIGIRRPASFCYSTDSGAQ
jgi:HK97 family phage major capsid protein/HK97 family phage prohead protease